MSVLARFLLPTAMNYGCFRTRINVEATHSPTHSTSTRCQHPYLDKYATSHVRESLSPMLCLEDPLDLLVHLTQKSSGQYYELKYSNMKRTSSGAWTPKPHSQESNSEISGVGAGHGASTS
ncbi:short-chain dehydrogenase [Aspergillus luchuensis]|uniref:Short-chain dehydrogenase n=1 Tax=Aspergillus kawachii TaxID=1069201 RepID=A0A146FR00_ASPKA|nr:short-chain dehydrogenase [Aspergillus luchuensis]